MPKCKYVCAICEKEFVSKNGVEYHLKSNAHKSDLESVDITIEDLYYERETDD